MKYFSTRNKYNSFSFRHAVLKGLADDGGLFMPEIIPGVNNFNSLIENNLPGIAFEVLKYFTSDDIGSDHLSNICKDAFNFGAPLHRLNDNRFILELFHGPTLAFKDFGARFMSRVMGHFAQSLDKELNILVATSGDTGSAVASGFYNIQGIKVYILFPSGKVSGLQEKQLTTYNGNIKALEINGTFDDCQTLVKQAFLDKELNSEMNLSSANSINIARLLPQSVYYFYAYKQLVNKNLPLYFTIPSGNLGNLTAGLIAKKMGLPVTKFFSALNINKVFHDYLSNGKYQTAIAKATISNAMDVGNPSNLERIKFLYNDDIGAINENISSAYFDDRRTKNCIKEIFNDFNYIIDPHGAVGVLTEEKLSMAGNKKYNSIILETAHASKFKNIIDNILSIEIELPERLSKIINKDKQSIKLKSDYDEFKSYLLSQK